MVSRECHACGRTDPRAGATWGCRACQKAVGLFDSPPRRPPSAFVVRLAEAEGIIRDMLKPSTVEEANDLMDRAREFLTPDGEAAKRASEAVVDPSEGMAGDVPPTTGGDVPASPDRALDANRYHQCLGAKWMCEAIQREAETTFKLNRNFRDFAAYTGDKWKDRAFWSRVERGE